MSITSIINEATKLILSFMLWFPIVFFAWMVIDIILTSRNPERRKHAGARLTWGIVAMFILISLGGIVAVLDQTFFGSSSAIAVPPGGSNVPPPSKTRELAPQVPGTRDQNGVGSGQVPGTRDQNEIRQLPNPTDPFRQTQSI